MKLKRERNKAQKGFIFQVVVTPLSPLYHLTSQNKLDAPYATLGELVAHLVRALPLSLCRAEPCTV